MMSTSSLFINILHSVATQFMVWVWVRVRVRVAVRVVVALQCCDAMYSVNR